jgi:hypothetical protein
MQQRDHIPLEIRAHAEASALFLALHRGELAQAAQAQERLRQLGWNLTKEQPKQDRRKADRL